MKIDLNDAEGRILRNLLEDSSDDIVIRLDHRGFIVHASANIAELGLDLGSLLLKPHITDLAETNYSARVAEHVAAVLSGTACRGRIEFPVRACAHSETEAGSCTAHECQTWFALSLQPVGDDDGTDGGAIGLLRSVQRLHALEHELHARAVTDPLTGLANRHAFCASLRRHLATGGGQMVAVFGIDGLRALTLQYGQRTADEVLWGFAKFLEAMTLPGHELAQIDGERFGVILPDSMEQGAQRWVDDVLRTFAALAEPSSARGPQLSASAGLARIECTVDWVLRQAELGLVMARAGGGMQAVHCARQQDALQNGGAAERYDLPFAALSPSFGRVANAY